MLSTNNKSAAVATVITLAACALLAWQLVTKGAWLMGDFRAFYCGGAMILHGVNPYAAAPLLHCERIPQPFGLHSARAGVDLPVPFPGYVLAIFVPVALLPYPLAAAIWFVLLLAATAVACIVLAQLCDRPVIVPFVLLAFALGVAVIPYGEVAPIIIAALTAGAQTLRSGMSWKVMTALAVTALLPYVALPLFLTLFIYVRAARLTIVFLGFGLVALDFAVGGPRLALSYFTQVLPNHAASEIGYIMQYSAVWFAQGLGASNRLALICGELSYVVMIVAGVWLAGSLSRQFGDRAFLFLIPAACAVIGGPFVHYSEITLALPAALLVYSRSSGKARSLAGLSLVLIALPWQWVLTQPLLALPIVLWTVAIVSIVLAASPAAALRAGFVATLFCAACMVCAIVYGPQIVPHVGPVLDPALAEASWARFISEKTSSAGFTWWAGKLPTWIGLILFAIAAARAAAAKGSITYGYTRS